MIHARAARQLGLTLIELTTAVVALVVLAAIAIPLWNNHQLRQRREGAVDLLLAVQAAQDRHFAARARYADDSELFAASGATPAMNRNSAGDFYRAEVERSPDGLSYVVIARAAKVAEPARADSRCSEFRLDGQGRRWSLDREGKDSTADCWNRL